MEETERGAIRYFITGIGTAVGKTVASAILTEALNADYWKPVQTGGEKDYLTIESLLRRKIKVHKSAYDLSLPASPDIASKEENIVIDLKKIQIPETQNALIVEGAGGVLVPLNDEATQMDLIKALNIPVVLVIREYLGCINHSLLTLQVLKSENIEVAGIMFFGEPGSVILSSILRRTKVPCILQAHLEESVDTAMVKKYAKLIRDYHGLD